MAESARGASLDFLSALRAIYIRLVTEATEGRTDGIYAAEMRKRERERKRQKKRKKEKRGSRPQRRRTGHAALRPPDRKARLVFGRDFSVFSSGLKKKTHMNAKVLFSHREKRIIKNFYFFYISREYSREL